MPYNWIGHIPFAYDLIRKLQPRLLVELGTHTGNSFLAMCESVLDYNLGTQIYAIDTWVGDQHAGSYPEQVYKNLSKYVDAHYPFAHLLRKTFDEALQHFEDNSVDLLHIDGLHTYEAVKHDYETWLPKLADPSIILFHDVAETRDDFGVWQLWRELKDRHDTTYEFTHNHGLGIVLIDTKNTKTELKQWLEQNAKPNSSYHIYGEWLWYQYAYQELYDVLKATRTSKAFRIGKLLLTPLRLIFK